MFPGEAEFLNQVSQELDDFLELGYATVNLGIEMITERYPTIDPSNSPTAYRVGNGLCVRACKLLRASLELARIGADTELTILSRSLFETFVATNFVLLPTLTLRPLGKTTSALTCNDRAQVYLGFQKVSHLQTLERIQQHPSACQEVRDIDTSKLQNEVAEIVASIGVDWVNQFQRRPYTYSGMNLRELTEAIGKPCDGFYALLYGVQSRSTHAADADAHVSFSVEEKRFLARWYPAPRMLRHDLVLVTSMVWGCLDLLNQQYRFDGDTDSDLKIGLAMLGRLGQ